ncbi:MAG: hypothetical protein AB7P40_14545 [Chloroflexota bacterium]
MAGSRETVGHGGRPARKRNAAEVVRWSGGQRSVRFLADDPEGASFPGHCYVRRQHLVLPEVGQRVGRLPGAGRR